MPMIPYHPAPGFGDLLPGSFVVPQNPIRGANTPLVPSVQAKAGGKTAYIPHIGDLLPGTFTVPFNPIRSAIALATATGTPITHGATGASAAIAAGKTPGMGALGCGSGCGCNGANFYGLSGLGDTTDTLSGIENWFSGSTVISGIPNWALAAGGVVALMLIMPSGSEYRSQSRALRSRHRGYKRIARAAGAAAQ